jgi:hypothetical protein
MVDQIFRETIKYLFDFRDRAINYDETKYNYNCWETKNNSFALFNFFINALHQTTLKESHQDFAILAHVSRKIPSFEQPLQPHTWDIFLKESHALNYLTLVGINIVSVYCNSILKTNLPHYLMYINEENINLVKLYIIKALIPICTIWKLDIGKYENDFNQINNIITPDRTNTITSTTDTVLFINRLLNTISEQYSHHIQQLMVALSNIYHNYEMRGLINNGFLANIRICPKTITRETFASMRLDRLKNICIQNKIKKYSRLNKDDLVNFVYSEYLQGKILSL